jgi:uracil-DNA glycosylase
MADRTILWNALQLHPHLAGNPWSNRTPTAEELELGKPALHLLAEAFPDARIIAVGKKAEFLLKKMEIKVHACVRHPAYGGATEFDSGMKMLVGQN